MHALGSFCRRLRDWFRRKRLKQDLELDLECHLSALEERNRERGLGPEEARAEARRELGNLVQIREAYHEQAGFPLLEAIAGDLRHATRSLVRRPLFSLGVILVLGLALCLHLVVGALGRAVFVHPLAVRDPSSLHLVMDPSGQPSLLSYGTAERLGGMLGGGRVAAYSMQHSLQMRSATGLRSWESACLVNGAFFQVLGLQPLAGRLLEAGDDDPVHGGRVVVLSEHMAIALFDSPSLALGHSVTLNGEQLVVVGVLPASFPGAELGSRIDLWLPCALQSPLHVMGNCSIVGGSDRENDGVWNREERVSWLRVFVRAGEDGAALPAAVLSAYSSQAEELCRAFSDEKARQATLHRRFDVPSSPGGYSQFRAGYRRTDALLGAFSTVFLVLAAVNVGGLMLVRALGRQRELGVRLALGGRPSRLFLLLAAEPVLLSATGAVTGLVLAHWLMPFACRLLAPGPAFGEMGPDYVLYGRLALIAAAIALLGSVLPSGVLLRLQPREVLSGAGFGGRSPAALGRLMVGIQICITMVLAAVSLGLGQSLSRALAVDPGFTRSRVLSSWLTNDQLLAGGYSKDFFHTDLQALDRIRSGLLAFPEVESVAFSITGLAMDSRNTTQAFARGGPGEPPACETQQDVVSTDYFRTSGIRLLGGREFGEGDGEKTGRVAAVNRTLARRLFGEDNPLGRHFSFGPADTDEYEVVGVVADVRANGLHEQAPSMLYLPLAQQPRYPGCVMLLRLRAELSVPIERIGEVVKAQGAGLEANEWRSLEDRLQGQFSSERTGTRLAYSIAASAIVLAMLGMSVLTSYLVAQRRREFAIRLAVGADPANLRRVVLREAFWVALAGSLWGAGLLLVFRSLAPVAPTPQPLLSALALCLLMAVLAAWGPAASAVRSSPLALLRGD